MNSLRSQNPFLLVLLTVGLLGLLSFLKPGLTVGGVELRPVRLLADVLRKSPSAAAKLELPPPNGLADQSAQSEATDQDTIAISDTVGVSAPDSTAGTEVAEKKPTGPKLKNLPGLEQFVAALHQTKATGSKTRIAYFGDSMIEGDLLTSDLRNSLQAAFGGSGVGFVPVNSVTAEFRETIHETFSPDWYEFNLVSDRRAKEVPLGISGHVFLPSIVSNADSSHVVADTSWVQFQAGQRFAPTRRFVEARLFYGPGARRDQVLVTTDGRRVPHALDGAARVNELVLKPGTPARRMRLAFATHGPRPVYGVSFESPQGITLDNFSFRGNSGMSLTRIPFEQLAAFGKALDYRLIILHYGVNIADSRNKNYVFYEQAMTRVIDRMQRAFPNASILVVGMSDKSKRIDGEFVTDPAVPLLVSAQQRLARRNHAAFWNLFEAMGGENSMTGWVEQSPPLANKDYTHINSRGGVRMAGLLYAYLMKEYAQAGTAPAARPDSSASSKVE
jgi:lysophospholipase L1-like esterase